MQKLDEISQKIKTVLSFGIIDPHDSKPVFIQYFDDSTPTQDVGAIVFSNNKKNLRFLPIDHNKLLPFNNKAEEPGVIDGCIYNKYNIICFELCNLRKGYYPKVRKQFKETIRQFGLSIINQYKNKTFYLCRTCSIVHKPSSDDINYYADNGFSFKVVSLLNCKDNKIVI